MITATVLAAVYALRKELGLDDSDDEEEPQTNEQTEGIEMKVVNTTTQAEPDKAHRRIP